MAFIDVRTDVHPPAIPRDEDGVHIVTGAYPPPQASRAVLANEGEERMSTITTPRVKASIDLPFCPWWCTADSARHAWQLDRVGGTWTRTHSRTVGGFTMSATEWVSHDGTSRMQMHPTQADFVQIDGAGRASDLSEDLHQVMAILRRIESGEGQ